MSYQITARRLKKANYEAEAHISTQDFWKNVRERGHVFSDHPVLGEHGEDLSRRSYNFSRNRFRDVEGERGYLMQVYSEILEHESMHSDELEQLAKEIVNQIWKIDFDNMETELGEPDEDLSEMESKKTIELNPDTRKLVHKRITNNALSHGAAIHSMLTMHHMISKEIEAIDPELLRLYDQLAAGAHQEVWMMVLPMMIQSLSNMQAGSVKVEWDDDGPLIKAKAIVFPILVQELVKGVMELLTMQDLAKHDPSTLEAIYDYADNVVDEPWLHQVGPELWRHFLKVVPRNFNLKDVVLKVTQLEPEQFHNLVKDMIKSPQNAKMDVEELLKGER